MCYHEASSVKAMIGIRLYLIIKHVLVKKILNICGEYSKICKSIIYEKENKEIVYKKQTELLEFNYVMTDLVFHYTRHKPFSSVS